MACVAIVAGVGYADAKAVVKSRPNRSGNSTYYADLRWALERYGVGFEMNGRRAFRFTSWADMPDRAIVAVECHPPWPGNWHWVVFDRVDGAGFVFDPARRRGVRRDMNRIHGKSYMPILGGPFVEGAPPK